ncbi:Predicted dehydrogenase [Paenibacillus sp. UNCCL117]|uniref:Gfo/Idh/MocA family protein n=1 Tax=unclassified Paenibacillus TaxID=185978 RepID=UPI00087FD8D8|nr:MULTISPECIES: Gfo/Idh/MocA family oxidoreductase [unclassified Paenibacillus]SDC65572.1 Predicted dehydrogenase [Paenibacillus sp. cl123]SFW22799.1 Predicted dehydrogenase [Paenibacillus sp. UNCCL117]
MSNRKMKAGIIGCGNISGIYLKNGSQFGSYEIAACADIDLLRAQAKAQEYGIRALTVEELLADQEIEIVINLTIPAVHAKVCLQALEAGKHVYVEKPLAVTREDGRRILELADSRGLRVGCAPDTFLGGGIQTCRRLMDEGAIGVPVAASGFMMSRGHEHWHPDPQFYYEPGGGPMFDMGPYYLTALVALLGPIRRVTGAARVSFAQRTVSSKPKAGTVIEVKTPTHVAGVLDFAGGAIGTLITSFDIMGGTDLPHIEIYGSAGSLRVPDPNRFGGPVYLRKLGAGEWTEVPLTHGYADNNRGVGVADMAAAIREGRPHRASGALAYHVLDTMHGFHEASAEGRHVELQSACTTPEPLAADARL